MESFFSSLQTERIARRVYRSCDEARADVFDYSERIYTTKAAPLDYRLSQPCGARNEGRSHLTKSHLNSNNFYIGEYRIC